MAPAHDVWVGDSSSRAWEGELTQARGCGDAESDGLSEGRLLVMTTELS